ncbi:hypothetical protein HK097_007504 [Rhizophlyctis rosea]|uniref:Methyltransferase domain-containing protein n=1 Tax=Rhizophlyctis rosea TaxID=64517 RepID=A0AAD5X274_9FUNG|nr:hypothetical protein HK097_007504 [Rhizophlyctis rosea]
MCGTVIESLSATQLDLARQNLARFGERVTLSNSDTMFLEFSEKSLDAVVGFYSIIHFPRDEQTVVLKLKRIAGWLRPGGFFLANFSSKQLSVAVNEKCLGDENGWMFWSGWGAEGTLKNVQVALQEEVDEKGHAPLL